MPRETKKGVVLLAIGVYATSILFIKVFFALVHHIKWLIFERCCRSIRYDGFRKEKLKNFWVESYRQYSRMID